MHQIVSDILKSATIVSSECSLREAVRMMTGDHRDRVYVTDKVGRVTSVVNSSRRDFCARDSGQSLSLLCFHHVAVVARVSMPTFLLESRSR